MTLAWVDSYTGTRNHISNQGERVDSTCQNDLITGIWIMEQKTKELLHFLAMREEE